MRALLTALAIVLGIGGSAHAQFVTIWGSSNLVTPLPGNGNFEVISVGTSTNMRLWCDAGTYALTAFGAGATDRLYVLNPLGKSKTSNNSQAVGFTILPDVDLLAKATRPGDGGNYSLSVSKQGFNISTGHARGYCIPFRLRN